MFPSCSKANPTRRLGARGPGRLSPLLLVFLWLFPVRPCFGADLLYVCASSKPAVPEVVRGTSEFYGLSLHTLCDQGANTTSQVSAALAQSHVSAVIFAADVLSSLDRRQILKALSRSRPGGIPILLLDADGTTSAAALSEWSEGEVRAAAGPLDFQSAALHVSQGPSSFTRELGGQDLPLAKGSASYLVLKDSTGRDTILGVATAGGTRPVLVRTNAADQEIFVAARFDAPPPPDRQLSPLTVFPHFAAVMMFVRYSAGDAAWHAPGHYANLTIDDAWLAEPYGNLNYDGLVRHMQSANFHTTIAFIPWNYDRSRPGVVALFRAHPERLSISIHGNNHDHQEFFDYETKPLDAQIADIRQALARMEAFQRITGIPYDRVMVWPHEMVPPIPTLSALKQYSFLGDVDANPVPMDSKAALSPEFTLRAEHVRFGNFLTVRRCSVAAPSLPARVAIDSFLENPILLYAHQNLFADGIGAFDPVARTVNGEVPDVCWAGLGRIMQHAYRLRRTGEHRYDVAALSSDILLENRDARPAEFLIHKRESPDLPVVSVSSDGQPVEFQQAGDELTFQFLVPSASSRHVVIGYSHDQNLATLEIGKPSLRINGLRRISDFRDMVLSPFAPSRTLVRFYYRNLEGFEPAIENHFVAFLSSFILLIVIVIILKARRKLHVQAGDHAVNGRAH